jgi:hypothetical protein
MNRQLSDIVGTGGGEGELVEGCVGNAHKSIFVGPLFSL